MRVFLTGATGYVGGAVAAAFLRAGHEVAGLARSETSAATLSRHGVTPIAGRMQEPASWQDRVREYDTLIHAAVDDRADVASADRAAVEGLIHAARSGQGPRSLIFTSGVWVLGMTGDEPADESASTDHPAAIVAWRPAHEALVLEQESPDLSTAVIRPGMIYGGSGGTATRFFSSAEREGAAVYMGDGTNRWSMVHLDDVARLYLEVAGSRGRGIFHAVDGTPLRVAEVARAASEAAGCGGRTRSQPLDEVRRRMGIAADAYVLDQVVSAPRAHALGWRPRHASFAEGARAAYGEWKAARVPAGGAA
jgi:nucleoside-diphosphate-sugar epimerase